jgi:hypothetical protein
MAANTLTSNSISSTYAQILHIGTGTAGVSTVRTGDGTTTVLSFVSGGSKVTGTFEVTTNLVVGGTATITGALAVTGAITGLGIPVYRHLTSDVTASTTTQVAISAFNFVPVSGAVYQVEMDLIATSASTSTGVRLVNTGGAGTLILADPGSAISLDAIGGTYAATTAPASASNFGIRLAGVFAASDTATLSFSLVSEVAASSVSLKAGSILKITRIS